LVDEEAAGQVSLWIGIARKALDADLLSPLAAAWNACFDGVDSKFAIPHSRSARTGESGGSPSEWFALLRTAMPKLADRFFPRDCWAWTLSREFALASGGRTRHLANELSRAAEAEHWGPLAEFCAATGSGYLGATDALTQATTRSMKAIGDTGGLRRDCAVLLSADYPAGRFAFNFGKFIRSLDGDEAALVTGILEQSKVPGASPFVQSLRADRSRPVEDVLQAALEKGFTEIVAQMTAEQLKHLKK
jgi:hypothetical protein